MRIFRFIVIGSVFLLLLSSVGQALSNDQAWLLKQLHNKEARIVKEIARLNQKVVQGVSSTDKVKIAALVKGYKARLAKIQEKIIQLGGAISQSGATAPLFGVVTPEVGQADLEGLPGFSIEAVAPKSFLASALNFEVEGRVGLFSRAMSAFGGIRLPLGFIVGPARSALRLAVGYTQPEDIARRYVLVQADGILNYPAGWLTGVENYLGLGVNYVVLTSDRVAGTVGGECFYGIDSDGFGGKLYGELGYGYIGLAGATPAYHGLTLMMGYRLDFGRKSPWQIFWLWL